MLNASDLVPHKHVCLVIRIGNYAVNDLPLSLSCGINSCTVSSCYFNLVDLIALKDKLRVGLVRSIVGCPVLRLDGVQPFRLTDAFSYQTFEVPKTFP